MENENAKGFESKRNRGGALLWVVFAIAILAGIFFVISYNDSKLEDASMVLSLSTQQTEVDKTSVDLTKNVVVGPALVDCTGSAPQKCMMVDDELFYDQIEGFEYEEGYVYVLELEKNELTKEDVALLPADSSSISYTLVSEVNKVPVDIIEYNWQWVGTEYIDNDDSVVPEDPSQFILVVTAAGNYAALTDCNNTLGNYTIDDEDLAFAPGASTKMYCEGSLDTVFADNLTNVEEYVIDEENGHLILSLDGSSGEMIFAPVAKVDPRVTATVWEWVETKTIYGQEITPKQKDAFRANFSVDGSFSATTDCNNLTGSYDATIFGKMTFGPFGSTKKACPPLSQGDAFSKSLSQTNEYSVVSDTKLLLKQKFGSVMIFTAVSIDAD